jgi:hypothetical protein
MRAALSAIPVNYIERKAGPVGPRGAHMSKVREEEERVNTWILTLWSRLSKDAML